MKIAGLAESDLQLAGAAKAHLTLGCTPSEDARRPNFQPSQHVPKPFCEDNLLANKLDIGTSPHVLDDPLIVRTHRFIVVLFKPFRDSFPEAGQ